MTVAKIECKGLWKVYGPGVEKAIRRRGGRVVKEDLDRDGVVGALRDVNLQIETGEVFAIMGLSGSGKSTLVRCMSRIIESTTGNVLIEGRDIAQLSERELRELRRRKMAMVFQHFALLPHITTLDNVAFPLEVRGVTRKERQARARETLELVGLAGREDYYPPQLSGGQQQRIGIARAVVAKPDIWFLDEPFSALDPLIRTEMQDEFLRIESMLNVTAVFITHDFLEAVRVADRIAIMKDGRVEQIGTAEEIVMHPTTPYIEKFCRRVPRADVLRARSIMVPASEFDHAPTIDNTTHHVTVGAGEVVASFAERVMQVNKPVPVINDEGVVAGYVTPAHVVNVLIDRGRQGEA